MKIFMEDNCFTFTENFSVKIHADPLVSCEGYLEALHQSYWRMPITAQTTILVYGEIQKYGRSETVVFHKNLHQVNLSCLSTLVRFKILFLFPPFLSQRMSRTLE